MYFAAGKFWFSQEVRHCTEEPECNHMVLDIRQIEFCVVNMA